MNTFQLVTFNMAKDAMIKFLHFALSWSTATIIGSWFLSDAIKTLIHTYHKYTCARQNVFCWRVLIFSLENGLWYFTQKVIFRIIPWTGESQAHQRKEIYSGRNDIGCYRFALQWLLVMYDDCQQWACPNLHSMFRFNQILLLQ